MKLKVILPFVVIAVGILGAAALIASRDTVQTRPPEVPPPLVRVLPVGIQDLQLRVFAQGTVVPRTESTLIAQVPGEIISVAPAFASGGFFEKGDVLLKIDPRDYEVAVAQARVQVAQAELRLAREKEEADLARKEWEKIGTGKATPLVLREPHIAETRAALEAARGALARANPQPGTHPNQGALCRPGAR